MSSAAGPSPKPQPLEPEEMEGGAANGATGALVSFVSGLRFDAFSHEVRHYAKRHLMDTVGNKSAATEIAGIKVAVPNIALEVIDRAIQVHGAAGLTQFFPLAHMYAQMRALRIADGPDEVHKFTIARREILKHHPGFRIDPLME